MNLKIKKGLRKNKLKSKKDFLDLLKLPKQKNESKKSLTEIWYEVRYGESKKRKA